MTDVNQDSSWHFSPRSGYQPNLPVTVDTRLARPTLLSQCDELAQNAQKVKRSFSEIRHRPSLLDYWIRRKYVKDDSCSFHPFRSCNERVDANKISRPNIKHCTPWYHNGQTAGISYSVKKEFSGQTIHRNYSFKFPYEKKRKIEEGIQQRITERQSNCRMNNIADDNDDRRHQRSSGLTVAALLSAVAKLTKSTFRNSANLPTKKLHKSSSKSCVKKCQSASTIFSSNNNINTKGINLRNGYYSCNNLMPNETVRSKTGRVHYKNVSVLFGKTVNSTNSLHKPRMAVKKCFASSSALSTSLSSSALSLNEELAKIKCFHGKNVKTDKDDSNLWTNSSAKYYPVTLRADCTIRIPRVQLVSVRRSNVSYCTHDKDENCRRCRSIPEIVYNKNDEKFPIDNDDIDSVGSSVVGYDDWNSDEDDDVGDNKCVDSEDSEEYGYNYEHNMDDTTAKRMINGRIDKNSSLNGTALNVQRQLYVEKSNSTEEHRNDKCCCLDAERNVGQNSGQAHNTDVQQATKFEYYSESNDSDCTETTDRYSSLRTFNRIRNNNEVSVQQQCSITDSAYDDTDEHITPCRRQQQYFSLRQRTGQQFCNNSQSYRRSQLAEQQQQKNLLAYSMKNFTTLVKNSSKPTNKAAVPLLKSKSWTGERRTCLPASTTVLKLPDKSATSSAVPISTTSPLQRTYSVRQVHTKMNDVQCINLLNSNTSTKQLNADYQPPNAATVTSMAKATTSGATTALSASVTVKSINHQQKIVNNSDNGSDSNASSNCNDSNGNKEEQGLRTQKNETKTDKMRRVHSLCDPRSSVIYRDSQLLGYFDGYHRRYRQRHDQNTRPLSITLPISLSNDDLTQFAEFPSQYEQDILNVEYGPGIVQKLREKFTQLSREVTSTARVSRHSTRKRFPSVDDILSTSTTIKRLQISDSREQRYRVIRDNDEQQFSRPQITLPDETFKISHSSSDSNFCQNQGAALQTEEVGTAVNVAQKPLSSTVATSLDYSTMPIRALKEKFERSSRELIIPKAGIRTVGFRRNNRSHSATPQSPSAVMARSCSLNDADEGDAAGRDDDEPEFIRIQRRLRNLKQEDYDHDLDDSPKLVNHQNSDRKDPPVVTKACDVSLPKFSNSARLTVYSPTQIFDEEHSSPRPASILDLDNPPDPDSACASPSHRQSIQTEYTFSLLPQNCGCDRSPPPEEPKPPVFYDGKTTGLVYSTKNTASVINVKSTSVDCQDISAATLSKPRIPVDDKSGIQEMRQLLSKFNVIREQKNLNEGIDFSISPTVTSTAPLDLPSSPEKAIAGKLILKPKARFDKRSAFANNQELANTNSAELLRTRKSTLVAVPKPRDFAPANSSNHNVQKQQFTGENTGTSTSCLPNANIQTVALQQSSAIMTNDSVLVPSPQLVPSEVSGSNNKNATASDVTPRDTTIKESQNTVTLIGISAKVDDSQDSDIIQAKSAVNCYASNSTSPGKLISQENQRKSLSSKFFESRSQFSTGTEDFDALHKKPLENITRRPKPYGDDATEMFEISMKAHDFASEKSSLVEETDEFKSQVLKTNVTSNVRGGNVSSLLEKFSRQQIVDDDDDNDLSKGRPSSLPSYTSFTAGDGNPVRHSLINLVMEEDVPLLMEAMAEKLDFEFEDVSAVPSSSFEGIIRTSSQRRRKQRSVSRIGFSDSPPAVFSYPDETTATEFSEWHPGEDISFEEYQQICEVERQKYEDERFGANKWQSSLIANNASESNSIFSVSEQPTVGDFAIGVTSRISYSNSPPYNAGNSFEPNTNISLIAGK